MPKYWGKQIFTHGRFPEVSEKYKAEKKREKKRGENNGQLRFVCHHGWHTQAHLNQFYFGLILFVCVVLLLSLLTAELNNNADFPVVGGGWATYL